MQDTLPALDPSQVAHRLVEPVDDHDRFGLSRSAFDFRYIIAAIRANLWLISAIIAAAFAIALVATMLQTKRYTATSTIQINDTRPRVLGDKEDQSDVLGTSGFDVDRFLKTQVDVLQSRGLALRVAQKLKLVGNPRLYNGQGVPAPKEGTSAEDLRNQAVTMLGRNLEVRLPRDSRIVTINYTSTDPELSAQVANAYASEFIQSNLQRKFDSSSYARDFLAGQLQEAKRKLEESELAVNAYARAAGLIRTRDAATNTSDQSQPSGGTSVTSTSLMQLNAAANAATARRIEAEGRWRAISRGNLMTSSEVISNSTVSRLLEQRAVLESELSLEKSRHLDDYPAVRSKASELAAINQQLAITAANVRASI